MGKPYRSALPTESAPTVWKDPPGPRRLIEVCEGYPSPVQYSPAHSTGPGTETGAELVGGCQPKFHSQHGGSVLPATIVSSLPSAANLAGRPCDTTPLPPVARTLCPPAFTEIVGGTPVAAVGLTAT